ncbi:MAG: hypothetical protein FIA92_13515 [Chloroflexi bacterium]|nr:hypothetical protein [Chloroflexota bacterium]
MPTVADAHVIGDISFRLLAINCSCGALVLAYRSPEELADLYRVHRREAGCKPKHLSASMPYGGAGAWTSDTVMRGVR